MWFSCHFSILFLLASSTCHTHNLLCGYTLLTLVDDFVPHLHTPAVPAKHDSWCVMAWYFFKVLLTKPSWWVSLSLALSNSPVKAGGCVQSTRIKHQDLVTSRSHISGTHEMETIKGIVFARLLPPEHCCLAD